MRSDHDITGDVRFPSEWTFFGPLLHDSFRFPPEDWPVPSRDALRHIQDSLSWGGQAFAARQVAARRSQCDFRPFLAEQPAGDRRMQAVFAFVPLTGRRTGEQATLGLSGDTWIKAWLNGDPVLQTAPGPRRWPPSIHDQRVTVALQEGQNVLAVLLVCGHRSVTTGSAVLAMGGPHELRAGDSASILSDPIENDPLWMREAPRARPAGKPAVAIGTRRELFVDEFILDGLAGSATRQLCRPVPQNIAFLADQPWEGATAGYYALVRDGGRVLLYYSARPDRVRHDESRDQYTGVAESPDGIEFTRIETGLVPFQGSLRNNLVFQGTPSHNFTPFLDENPAAAPDARFKSVAYHTEGKGLGAFGSPDGIHWRALTERRTITQGSFDSQNTAFWDPNRGCYVCYCRDNSTGVRRIMRSISEDFLRWSDPEPVRFQDARNEHMYTNGIRPYFRAPHIYLGVPARFVPHRQKIAEHSTGGISDAVLIAGRDGCAFERWEEGFLRPGPEPEVWTDRNNYPAWGLVQTSPTELSLYWSEHYRHPGNRLRRGVLRIDGFAALHAAADELGEALTRPLVFTGARLVVNYATSAIGSLRFALCDEAGKALAGFDLADSEVLFGNEIGHEVVWRGGASPGALAGRPVRLRIRMQDAQLFAFQFAE